MSFLKAFSLQRSFSSVLFLAAILCAACGGGGGGGSQGFRVVSSDPAANTAAVSVSPLISFRFNRSLDASTVNETNFSLFTSAGSIPSSISYDNSLKQTSIMPSRQLALAATHTARAGTGVKDVSGKALSGNFDLNFTTRDGVFLGATPIESNPLSSSLQTFRLHSNGIGFALWTDSGGSTTNIWVNRFDPASGWGTPFALASGILVWALPFTPDLAIDSEGNAIAVWEQRTDTNSSGTVTTADLASVVMRRYEQSSGSWSALQILDSTSTLESFRPLVTIDALDNAFVIWAQKTTIFSDPYDLWVRRYSKADDAWSPVQVLESGTRDSANYKILADSSGNGLAVWSQNQLGDTGSFDLTASYFELSSNTWGSPTILDNVDVGSAYVSDAGFAPNGEAFVLWQQKVGAGSFFGDLEIVANHYIPGGGWQGPESLETQSGGETLTGAKLSIDAEGNALAVFPYSKSTGRFFISNYYKSGEGWQGERTANVDLTAGGLGFFVFFSAAFDPTGDAILAWGQSLGGQSHIYANRFDPTTGWGTPVTLEAIGGTTSFPRLSVDVHGNALVTWLQDGGGGREDLWANRYLATSGWQGPQILETDNSGEVNFSQHGFDSLGRAVVIWGQVDSLARTKVTSNIFQ